MEDKKPKDITERVDSPEVTEADKVSETSTGDVLETASEESAVKVEDVVAEVSDNSTDTPAKPIETDTPSEPVAESVNEVTEAKEETEGSNSTTKTNYLLAFFAIAIILALLWMGLEKQNRVSTNVFEGVFSAIGGTQAAAVVNGVKISVEDYNDNVSQLKENASLQGLDVTDPGLDTEIKTQALTILVNTELLRQEVSANNISVSDDQVEAKFTELITQIGGPEALATQLETVGVTEAELRDDIKYEIGVGTLLEQKLKFSEISATEEEMIAMYEQYGGEEAGLPPYEGVRPQLQAQVLAQKQQSLLQEYIDELRAGAEIENLI